MATPSLDAGSTFAHDFEIVRPLGVGGMGSVYVARQLSTGKLRALKLMLPQLVANKSLQNRFVQEARVGSLIESDHVVEVVAAGVDESTRAPWLAMELLVGQDLAALVESRGPLPVTEVEAILRQLCHALSAAHGAGIIHRDLKPENLFLAESKQAGDASILKVLDFGIAKVTAEAATRQTSAAGSPAWMAPEQSEHGVVTPAADLWAVGLIAFYLLTGRYYWTSAEHGSVHQIMREVLFDPIEPPSLRAARYGVGQRLPPWFDIWFARCVVRDVAARFANAAALCEAFNEASAHRPSSKLPQAMVPAPAAGGTEVGHPLPLTAPTAPGGTDLAAQIDLRPPRRSRRAGVVLSLIVLVAVLAGVAIRARSRLRVTDSVSEMAPVPAASASSTATPVAERPASEWDPGKPEDPGPDPSRTGGAASAPRKHAHAGGPAAASAVLPAPSTPPEAPAAHDPFDRVRAQLALANVDAQACAQPGGPRGQVRLLVTFEPNGAVSSVTFSRPGLTFFDTPTGDCLTARIRAVKVAPFVGAATKVVRLYEIR
jgi:serine/threonine protein kinase